MKVLKRIIFNLIFIGILGLVIFAPFLIGVGLISAHYIEVNLGAILIVLYYIVIFAFLAALNK